MRQSRISDMTFFSNPGLELNPVFRCETSDPEAIALTTTIQREVIPLKYLRKLSLIIMKMDNAQLIITS